MIKEEIAPGIVVYNDVIPNSENLYQDIEEAMKSIGLQWQEAYVREGSESKLNTLTRNTFSFVVKHKLHFLNPNPSRTLEHFYVTLDKLFFENCSPIEQDYMRMYGSYPDWHDDYQVLKYGEGQFFTNHIDDHTDYHRRISTVYYLNENYTGGEINFPRFNISLKPKANQMILFPSTYVYNHSVSPVTEGTRYCVVSWLR